MATMRLLQDSSGRTYSSVVLAGKVNYNIWAYTMREHLKTARCEDFIKSNKIERDREAEAQVAKSMLLSTIAPNEIESIIHCSTPYDIWNHLESAYGKKTSNEKLELITELNSLRCKSSKDVSQMVNKALAIKGKLVGLGMNVEEAMIMSALKNALPLNKFSIFLETWSMFDLEQQTLSRFVEKLQERTKALVAEEEEESALMALRGSSHSRGRGCGRCRGSGFNGGHNDSQNGDYSGGHNGGRGRQFTGYSERQSYHSPSAHVHVREHAQSVHNQAPRDPNHQQVVCNYCHNIGHIKTECQKLKRRMENLNQHMLVQTDSRQKSYQQNNARPYTCSAQSNQRSSQPSNQCANQAISELASDRYDQPYEQINFVALNTGQQPLLPTEWIIDSGCSCHMTSNFSWLENFQRFNVPVNIRIGDNSILHAFGSGNIPTSFGLLTDVYYVPDIGSNLLSVSAASDKQLKFEFDYSGLSIILNGRVILTVPRRGGTYIANIPIKRYHHQANYATTVENWHKRFSHLPLPLIMKMIREKSVDGLKIAEQRHGCADCKINKCKRASHSTRTTPKASIAGQALHFDIIGAISPIGHMDKKFILVGVDEFCGFRFTCCLKAKSQAPDTIKAIITLTEAQTGNHVIRITSDNASEFLSERLTCFLQAKGINHVLSAPYVPQQNGRAEKENSSLLNQARSILNSAKLDRTLWPYAIATATYVNNRSISMTYGKTPYEHWFNRKPNVNNLRVFGQHASVLIPERNREKFDEKGKILIFVGYTDNHHTYLFYDESSKKVVTSCDALFLDKTGPLDSTQLSHQKPETGNTLTSINIAEDSRPLDATRDQDPDQLKASDLDETGNTQTSFCSANFDTPIANRSDQTKSVGHINLMDNFPRGKLEDNSTDVQKLSPINDDASSNQEAPDISSNDTTMIDQPAPNSKTEVTKNTGSVCPQHNIINLPSRTLRDKPIRDYKAISKGHWDLSKEHIAKVASLQISCAPENFQEVNTRPDAESWYAAMRKEMESMTTNKVFELVPAPPTNIVGCRWVYTLKTMSDGSIQPKARLVAQGYSQRQGIDYHSTFSPVVHMDNIRLLFAMAATKSLIITQVDIKTAFLYGNLEEEIFMRQPDGFSDGTNQVWLLHKSIYGLKQAPKCWNQRFTEFISKLGFKQTRDNCIMFLPGKPLIIAIYVDDAIILSETKIEAELLVNQLQKEFELHQMSTNKFLGIEYEVAANGDVSIHQKGYITDILRRYGMCESNPAPTPFLPNSERTDTAPCDNPKLYNEIKGALQYAVTQTRIDLAFAVGYLGRHQMNPTKSDWQILKRCLRYLSGTISLGITYRSYGSDQLEAFSDADFAGDSSRKSTSGQVVLYGGGPISWRSKLQKTVVTGTTESEYLALTSTIKSVLCLKDVGLQLGAITGGRIPVHCDNKGAVHISTDNGSTQRTRWMGATVEFAREHHQAGNVHVDYVQADNQRADLLTKPLTPVKFLKNRNFLMTHIQILCTMSLLSLAYSSTGAISDVNHSADVRRSDRDTTFPYRFQFANLVNLIETRHYFAAGTILDTVNIAKRDYCIKWENELDNVKEGTARQFIVKRLYDICQLHVHNKYQKQLEIMTTFKPHRTSLRKRQAPESIMTSMPLDCSTPAKALEWWKYILLQITIVGKDIYDYSESESHENVAIQNRDCIIRLAQAFDVMNNKLNKTLEHNRLTVLNMQTSLNELSNLHDRVEDLTTIIPEIIHESSLINIELQRDLDLLEDLSSGFKKGLVDINALTKLTNQRYLPFHDIITEDTRFYNFSVTDDRMIIRMTRPNKEENVVIYKLISFIDWEQTTENNRCFKRYEGAQYLMRNVTNNCTKLIESPNSMRVHQRCLTANFTDNYYDSKYWKTHWFTEDEWDTVTTPRVEQIDLFWFVQCFGHESYGNYVEGQCPKAPFIIPINTRFSIDDRLYDNGKLEHNITLTNTTDLLFTPRLLMDPWRVKLESAFERIREQEKLDHQITQLGLDPIVFAQNHPWEVGTSTVGAAIIITLIMAYICCKKTDPITRLAQVQMLASMHDRQMSKSAPALYPATSQPSINIIHYNNNYRAYYNAEDSGKQVRFDESTNSLYPELKHSVSMEKSFRPPTPFALPSAPSMSSCNTHVDGNLPRMQNKPNRFLTTMKALSTLSLPHKV